MGRFLSVDPNIDIEAAFSFPQSWNRYSYVVTARWQECGPNGCADLLS
jgi:hypothetical protein